jgi:hypothetical protein
MSSPERRSDPRYLLKIPVSFRCFDATRAEEVSTEATNISRSGMFITSPRPLAVGSSLRMCLRVPTEISGSVFSQLQCIGRVVHEQSAIGGAVGYGIAIEKFSRDLRADGGFTRPVLTQPAAAA